MSCIMDWFETVGRARAAAYMTSLGYHKEAKKLMLEVKQLQAEKEAK